MARPIRLDYPQTFYHVLSRGNERRDIFRGKDDYERFMALLGRMVEKFGVEIHAYVLMSNHYHLLIRTRDANLSRAIQWLGVSYSTWFNRRHSRSGHLFQGRFKSFVIENESYLTALCLYIHRNPIRAGIVSRLAEYPWSSYASYSGEMAAEKWMETSVVFSVCGNRRKRFIEMQRSYAGEEGSTFVDLRCGLFFGSEDFAERWQERLIEEKGVEKPQARGVLRKADISMLARGILKRLGESDIDSLLKPRRRDNRPGRDLAMYVLNCQGIYTNKEIGEVFGVGYTSVTGAVHRAEKYLQKEGAVMQNEVEKLVNGK